MTEIATKFLNSLFDRYLVKNALNHFSLEISQLDTNTLTTMPSKFWLHWLNHENGREKFMQADEQHSESKKFRYLVNSIGDCIRSMSKTSNNNVEILNHPFWTSTVPSSYRSTALSIFTHPYPMYEEYIFEFHTTTITGDDMKEIENVTKFINNLLINYKNQSNNISDNMPGVKHLINVILKKFKQLYIHQQNYVAIEFRYLFFILLDPMYQNQLFTKPEDDFSHLISYMFNWIRPIYLLEGTSLKHFQTFAQSLNNYLCYADGNEEKSKLVVKILNMDKILGVIWLAIFTKSPSAFESQDINTILKECPCLFNALISDKIIRTTEYGDKITIEPYMQFCAKNYKEFGENGKYRNTETHGYLARLLYKSHIEPCLDIFISDNYVKSLSDNDKELITLWTHASSLFKSLIPIHNSSSSSSSKSLDIWKEEDGERSRWLINRLYQIIMNAPNTRKQQEFYRGLSVPCKSVKAKYDRPMSVSYNKQIALNFAMSHYQSGCLLVTQLPEKSKMLAVDRVSIYYGREKEILILPGSEFNFEDEEDLSSHSNQMNVLFKIESVSGIKPLFVTMDQQPEFVDIEMTMKEIIILLSKITPTYFDESCDNIKSDGKCNDDDNYLKAKTLFVKLQKELTYSDIYEKNIFYTNLFNSIRTWQLLNCGFGGDVKLAINQFFKQLMKLDHIGAQNLKSSTEKYFESRKSLLHWGKNDDIETEEIELKTEKENYTSYMDMLDTMRDFIKFITKQDPFVLNNSDADRKRSITSIEGALAFAKKQKTK